MKRMHKVIVAIVSVLSICVLSCALADDHYAAQNGQTPSGTYTTWASAASNIQDAVNVAAINDTVWVGSGHYVAPDVISNHFGPNVVVIDKALTLCSSNGVQETAIIDGGGINRGVAINNPIQHNPNPFVVDGFTISNCYATNFGGGIFLSHAPTGGDSSTTMFYNCTISDNTASNKGGGLYLSHAGFTLMISNCVIRNNMATNNAAIQTQDGGGGLYAYGNVLITDSEIYSNWWSAVDGSIDSGGGGMWLKGYNSYIYTLRNTLMYANFSSDGGGAVFLLSERNKPQDKAVLNLENCTIVDNLALRYGGAGFNDRYNNLTITVLNSIIYSNAPKDFSGNCSSIGPDTAITNLYMTYSCTPTNGLSGVLDSSNITNNPAFVDWTGENLRLSRDSPCINAGLNQSWMDGGRDLDNHSRIDRFSGTVDMGCYEYLSQGMIFKMR